MMGPYRHPDELRIATMNAVAGRNRETIIGWYKFILKKFEFEVNGTKKNKDDDKVVTENFIELIASITIGAPYQTAKLIALDFYRLCRLRKNPEHNDKFIERLNHRALPTLTGNLQRFATELGLRASSAKHIKTRPGTEDEGV